MRTQESRSTSCVEGFDVGSCEYRSHGLGGHVRAGEVGGLGGVDDDEVDRGRLAQAGVVGGARTRRAWLGGVARSEQLSPRGGQAASAAA